MTSPDDTPASAPLAFLLRWRPEASQWARRDYGGEPYGTRLWLALAVVMVLSFFIQSYGITRWPMADDEVPSLVELNLLHTGAERFFSVPPDQIPKLPKATIVWNATQRLVISWLPESEWRYRVLGLVTGLLTSAIVFLVGSRWRGLWFGAALAILLNVDQIFPYLVQLNRFYSLAFFFQTLALMAMLAPGPNLLLTIATAVLTVLAVLSHNITLVVFVLTFMAAAPLFLVGEVPGYVVVRSGLSAALSLVLYVFYLLPLVRGWNSTGNPTPVLVSFVAHAGVPALALTGLGLWFTLMRPVRTRFMIWWGTVLVGSLCVTLVTPHMNWNPRYFLFFMPAVWMLGAHAMDLIAERLGYGAPGLAWYGAVIMLLLPGLLSHLQDGSRHDYRQAAAVVVANDPQHDPVLSDDAETISYYLPAAWRDKLEVRTKVTEYPRSPFFLVCRANAWMPQPRVPGRHVELLAEISHRRFDQFSHILRVYRVAADAP